MKRTLIKSLVLSVSTLCASVTSAFELSASERLQQLLQEHWQTANKEQVFFRKDPDAFRMNGKLPEMSQHGRDRRQAYNTKLLKRLDNIALEQLTPEEQVTYRLFKYERQTEAKSYQQLDHFYPLTYYSGFHSYFAGAPANMSFLTKKDYQNYLISLADFPRYNQEHIVDLKQAIKAGHTHYCETFKNYHKGISKHIVDDVTQSDFYGPIANLPANFSQQDKAYFTEQTTSLIKEKVIPEYQKFYDFFTQEYMPHCRKTVGISELSGGKDYYKYLIEFYTTTDMTADEIHQLGLDEVKRIRGEMQAIINKVGFKGDFKAFIKFLRTDERFYTDSERDMLEKASYITRKMAAQLPKWFSVLPRQTFDIKPAPNGGAYYVASDGSGTTSGTYFLDTKDLKSQPLYTLEALTFHEAEPGHHFQSAIAQEVDMPEFRKTLYHAAYGEGWGLYSERLGKEIGFYQDPYSDFGRLTYEAWRACRLVVDTGMHAKGWSRQQAIDYLAENTALSMADVIGQIDRYISWPGQALAYKIGEIKIRELRALAEQELGDKFNIRLFHDQLLKNGSLPMALLEELTKDWIKQQKS
ncbi:hypothetical protein tinsulaeT_17280 [Thalassotalea insulae]|uniref:DUF885 domain-containing protein n=1 Tax=Thalassotalea insulae TaxID=2056778 RepID=A0ABQ6GR06_9GAMM|nr:DUF885 domain-containing protein [Thalassotalea insulae]GLX78388.1 hypothetical protein tinsulaeT_17280 [Thalassotalea insulae]